MHVVPSALTILCANTTSRPKHTGCGWSHHGAYPNRRSLTHSPQHSHQQWVHSLFRLHDPNGCLCKSVIRGVQPHMLCRHGAGQRLCECNYSWGEYTWRHQRTPLQDISCSSEGILLLMVYTCGAKPQHLFSSYSSFSSQKVSRQVFDHKSHYWWRPWRCWLFCGTMCTHTICMNGLLPCGWGWCAAMYVQFQHGKVCDLLPTGAEAIQAVHRRRSCVRFFPAQRLELNLECCSVKWCKPKSHTNKVVYVAHQFGLKTWALTPVYSVCWMRRFWRFSKQ